MLFEELLFRNVVSRLLKLGGPKVQPPKNYITAAWWGAVQQDIRRRSWVRVLMGCTSIYQVVSDWFYNGVIGLMGLRKMRPQVANQVLKLFLPSFSFWSWILG